MYSPMPRYGHTITAINNTHLLLFGGVSEYKEKLKDRCFYADVWAYNIQKNIWRIMEFVGGPVRNRRGHAACVYKGMYYLVHGGIDDGEEVIDELAWANLSTGLPTSLSLNEDSTKEGLLNSNSCKNRWKIKKLDARYNHKMIISQTNTRDYLAIFGGRNSQSDIIGEFTLIPISVYEGELVFREPKKVNYNFSSPFLSQRANNLLQSSICPIHSFNSQSQTNVIKPR